MQSSTEIGTLGRPVPLADSYFIDQSLEGVQDALAVFRAEFGHDVRRVPEQKLDGCVIIGRDIGREFRLAGRCPERLRQ